MGSAVIGCDICQDVCPWNRKAPVTSVAEFQPRLIAAQTPHPSIGEDRAHSLFEPELQWLAALTQQEFSAIFRKSAVKRAKWRGMVRNACVALGNSGIERQSAEYSRIVQLLRNFTAAEDAVIAEHARWALARLDPPEAPAD